MKKRAIVLALLVVAFAIALVAAPAMSKGSYSGDQQYGRCDSCHSGGSTLTVTLQSSPSTSTIISPGGVVTIWLNVSGTVSGVSSVGGLIASSTGSSGSLPTENGWTITSDPSGTTYNYVKKTYSSSASFKWVLKAPSAAGSYPIYARAVHSGSNEYLKNAGPLTFTVGAPAPISPPTASITAPAVGAIVSGTITVTATATPASGQSIASVELRVDGILFGSDTTAPYSWSLNTASYSNGAHTLNVTAIDGGARKGYAQRSVTVSNTVAPTVSISSPSSGATVFGTVNVASTITPQAGATISSAELRIDGTLFGTDTTAPYSWSVDTNTLAKGAHTLNITATDNNAKKGYAQISVTVNNDAPTASITSPTSGATVSGTITVSATATAYGGKTISSVELRVDGTLVSTDASSPYSFSLDVGAYSNGQHSLNVTATDSNGKKGYAQISVSVNNAGATVVITAPANDATVSGTLNVAATATPSTGSSVTSVELRVDGALNGADTIAPYSWSVDTNALTKGAHSLNTTVTDSNGKKGYAQISVTVNNDRPTVTIDSPADGATVSGTTTVSVSAAAYGGKTIASVELRADGTLISTDSASPFSFSLDTIAYTNGQHTLNVTATDNDGKKGYAQSTVAVSNAGLSIGISSPAIGATVSGNGFVNASISGAIGASSVELRVDGALLGTDDTAPYGFPINWGSYVDGAHIVNVTVTDANSKKAYSQIQVTVTDPAPVVTVTSPQNDATVSGTIDVIASVMTNQTLSYVSLFIDGTEVGNLTSGPYSWSIDTTSHSNGAHALTVTAVDVLGKVGQQSIQVSVNNAGPTVSLLSPVGGTTVFGTISVSATGSGVASIDSLSLMVDGTAVTSVNGVVMDYAWDTNTVSDGSHTLRVEAVDSNGNHGFAEVSITVGNSAPGVSLISPANGTTVSSDFTLTANVVGVVGYVNAMLDGTLLGNVSSGPYAWNISTSSMIEGEHALQVTAVGSNGRSAMVMVTFTYAIANSSEAPNVNLQVPAPSLSGEVEMSANITGDQISHVLVAVDGLLVENITAAPYAWNLDTTELNDGTHSLRVTAVNSNGKVGYVEIPIRVSNALSEPIEPKGADMTIVIGILGAAVLAIVALLGVSKFSARKGGKK